MKILKTLLLLIVFSSFCNAQSVSGKLTLNGKSETELKLESNSAVQLFKEFKTGKYQLKFGFKGKEIPTNIYKEKIVFFEFITTIKKDGELVKNVVRKQPIPYFPGEMFIPAEAFDFIAILASISKEKGNQGVMPSGKYSIRLTLKSVDFKGAVEPVEFSFSTN
ncbi:hypothetical protein [Winogradskyella flava]|uniref:hypothetical protein n=1 Tax=Winogradskyella flava TaxID=1884876 RepID=UPI002492275D|nr:hypothetical protein [Winogradskyella flava]